MATEAQKRATSKYNIKNYSMLSVRLSKELITDFKAKCQNENLSQATIIKEAIESFLTDKAI